MQTGVTCGFCEEPIKPGEPGTNRGTPLHYECHMRLIIGSVAHIQRRCSCYVPGSTEDDPPHLTLREAARVAVQCFYAYQARN